MFKMVKTINKEKQPLCSGHLSIKDTFFEVLRS